MQAHKPKLGSRSYSVDAAELSRRLEFYRQEQQLAILRNKRHTSMKTNHPQTLAYIPRYADRGLNNATRLNDESKKTDQPRDHKSEFRHMSAPGRDWTNNATTYGNTKQILMHRNNGMSESEAIAACIQIDEDTQPDYQRARGHRHSAQVHMLDAQELSNRLNGKPHRFSSAVEDMKAESPRASIDADNPYLIQPPKNEADIEIEANKQHASKSRPHLQPHDRNDWAQESQYGGEARHHLHLPHRKAKDDASHADQRSNIQNTKSRTASAGAYQSDSMIADAVKVVKNEQKANRRASMLGLFKRS